MSYLTNSNVLISGSVLEDILSNATNGGLLIVPNQPGGGFVNGFAIIIGGEFNAVSGASWSILSDPTVRILDASLGTSAHFGFQSQFSVIGPGNCSFISHFRALSGTLSGGATTGGESGFSSEITGLSGVQNSHFTGGAMSGSADNFGLKLGDIAGSANSRAIKTGTGIVDFGDIVLTPATTTARASMRLPHGTAPSSPINGDIWTTTAGLFCRVNGVTVGPLS